MMNRTQKISAATVATALVLALSACQRNLETTTVASSGQPSQAVIHPGPTVQGTIRDPSLPDAATVFAAEEAAAKAKADAEALQQTATIAQSSLAPAAAPAGDATTASTPAAEKPTAEQAAAAPASADDKTKLN